MNTKQMKQIAEWCADVAQDATPTLYAGELFSTLHTLAKNVEEGFGLRYFDACDNLAPLVGKVEGHLLALVTYENDTNYTMVNLTIGDKSVTVERDAYLV